MVIEFGYQTPMTSDSEFYSTTTTTQSLVTSVRTKLWISFVGVTTFVKYYCKSCMACARSKASRHQPYGNLRQLPILDKPWNSISMDFIEQLPSSEGFTAILVIVDQLSKQAIYIPTYDTITSMQLAQLFVLHVFSKHRVPMNKLFSIPGCYESLNDNLITSL
jgi:hypothetical protein